MLPFYDINAKLRYIKFCLYLFTFLFVLTGVALIIIGSTVNAIYYEFMFFLQVGRVTPSNGLVFIGFLIFGVACLGLYGTYKMDPILIGAFGICLGVLCVLQLAAGIACHVMTETMVGRLRLAMNETMYDYPYSYEAAEKMNAIQENFACCGMYTVKDWTEVFGNNEIPRSCCAFSVDDGSCEYVHNTGCYGRLAMILNDSSRIASTSSGILALMQLLGMVFAFYMAQCLRQQIRARRERKLLVTEQLLYSDVEGTKPPKGAA